MVWLRVEFQSEIGLWESKKNISKCLPLFRPAEGGSSISAWSCTLGFIYILSWTGLYLSFQILSDTWSLLLSCIVCKVAGGQEEEYLPRPGWIYLQYQTTLQSSYCCSGPNNMDIGYVSPDSRATKYELHYTLSWDLPLLCLLWWWLQTNNSKDLFVKHKQDVQNVNQRPFNPLSSNSLNNRLSVSCLLS